MSAAAGMARWAPFAELLAMMANANRNPKRSPRMFFGDDFNPYATGRRQRRRRNAIVIDENTIGDVRRFFKGMEKGTRK